MNFMSILKCANQQPWLGLISTLLVVLISFAFIAQFDYHTFHTWVTYLSLTMIPTHMLMAAVWKSEHPRFIATLNQPMKGLAFLMLAILAGVIVAPLTLLFIGGSTTPPTPFVVMFCIHSVVMFIWLAKIFHGWPFNLISPNPLVAGLLMLVFSYLLTYVTFLMFFDFEFLKSTPFYAEALDPKGIFSAWTALVFSVTAAAVMLIIVMLTEQWPITAFAKKRPWLNSQPGQGVAATVFVLLISFAVFYLCVDVAGMDVVDFMVKVPISFIFGIFIYQNLLQRSLFENAIQPTKGGALIIVCGCVGLLMHLIYLYCAPIVANMELTPGAPHYQQELWIASAQLAVTFPVIVIFSSLFNFWPLRKSLPEEHDLVESVN